MQEIQLEEDRHSPGKQGSLHIHCGQSRKRGEQLQHRDISETNVHQRPHGRCAQLKGFCLLLILEK